MKHSTRVRKKCWFRLITFIVITALLCHDIAYAGAGNSRQSKLSPGHVDVERLQNDALDAFLGDERTGPYVFRHGRLPTPPRGLAKVLDGFLEVTGKAIIEGDIARIPVKIDSKPAILCFSREPSADGRRYWFETAASLKAPGSKDLTPDGIRYIETLLSLKETFVVKDEAEPNIIGRAVEEIRRRVPKEENDWQNITPGMVKVNVVDLDERLGIPRYPEARMAKDLIYAHSRIEDDGRLGIYITKRLWEREILREDGNGTLFLAELIDHEWQEKYLGRTHTFAAWRARYFCEDSDSISCFHRFYLTEIRIEDGKDGIDFLISLLEEERDTGDSSIRTYEEEFRGFIRDLLEDPIGVRLEPNEEYTLSYSTIGPFIIQLGEARFLLTRHKGGSYILAEYAPEGSNDLGIILEADGTFILGKDFFKDFPILRHVPSEPTISRIHLSVKIEGDTITLKDLGSSHGTIFSLPPVLTPREIPDSLPEYIKESVTRETKGKERLFAIQNLNQPELQGYSERALRKNITLIICREFQNALQSKREKLLRYLDILLEAIEELPSGLVDKAGSPLVLKVGKIEDKETMGQAHVRNTGGFARVGMTQFMDKAPARSVKAGGDAWFDVDMAFDKRGIANTLVHEIIGHKLSTVWNRQGRMIMPRQDWIDIAVINGVKSVCIVGDEQLEAIRRHYSTAFQRVPIDALPREEREFLQAIRRIYCFPLEYYEGLHELVAYSVTNEDLRKGDRNQKHRLEETRKILRRNLLREEEPVDKKRRIYRGYEFNGGKWVIYYIQNIGTDAKPKWVELTKGPREAKRWIGSVTSTFRRINPFVPEELGIIIPQGLYKILRGYPELLQNISLALSELPFRNEDERRGFLKIIRHNLEQILSYMQLSDGICADIDAEERIKGFPGPDSEETTGIRRVIFRVRTDSNNEITIDHAEYPDGTYPLLINMTIELLGLFQDGVNKNRKEKIRLQRKLGQKDITTWETLRYIYSNEQKAGFWITGGTKTPDGRRPWLQRLYIWLRSTFSRNISLIIALMLACSHPQQVRPAINDTQAVDNEIEQFLLLVPPKDHAWVRASIKDKKINFRKAVLDAISYYIHRTKVSHGASYYENLISYALKVIFHPEFEGIVCKTTCDAGNIWSWAIAVVENLIRFDMELNNENISWMLKRLDSEIQDDLAREFLGPSVNTLVIVSNEGLEFSPIWDKDIALFHDVKADGIHIFRGSKDDKENDNIKDNIRKLLKEGPGPLSLWFDTHGYPKLLELKSGYGISPNELAEYLFDRISSGKSLRDVVIYSDACSSYDFASFFYNSLFWLLDDANRQRMAKGNPLLPYEMPLLFSVVNKDAAGYLGRLRAAFRQIPSPAPVTVEGLLDSSHSQEVFSLQDSIMFIPVEPGRYREVLEGLKKGKGGFHPVWKHQHLNPKVPVIIGPLSGSRSKESFDAQTKDIAEEIGLPRMRIVREGVGNPGWYSPDGSYNRDERGGLMVDDRFRDLVAEAFRNVIQRNTGKALKGGHTYQELDGYDCWVVDIGLKEADAYFGSTRKRVYISRQILEMVSKEKDAVRIAEYIIEHEFLESLRDTAGIDLYPHNDVVQVLSGYYGSEFHPNLMVKIQDYKEEIIGKGLSLGIPFLASVSLALALLVPKMHLYPKGYSYLQVILWRNILSIVILTLSLVLPRYIITAWRQLKQIGEEVTLKSILRVVMANIRKEIERDWRVFTYVGIMLRGFAAICTFGALVYTSAFNVSLFMASTIVVVLLIDTFINLGRRFSVTDSLLNRITNYRPDRPKLHQFAFALLAGIGVYIALGGLSINLTIGTVGLIVLLLQMVLWSSSIIYQNNFSKELLKKGETFDPISMVNYSLIIGTGCFIIYGIFASMISPLFMGTAAQGLFSNLSLDSILTPIKHYLDLGLTSITMLVYYLFSHTAPKYTKPATFFIMMSAYPLFVALFSWMFYGAGIYSYQIIGALIVVAGITLFNYWSKDKKGENVPIMDKAIIPYFQKLFGRFGETKLYKFIVGSIVEEVIFRGIPLVIGAFTFTINPILGKILVAVWGLVLYKWFVNLHEDDKRTPARVAGIVGILFIALPFFFTQLPWWIIFGAIIFHSSFNIFQTIRGKINKKEYNLAIINWKGFFGRLRFESKFIRKRLDLDRGLCVTGDTLLPIISAGEIQNDPLWRVPRSKIQNTPIVDVQPGDYVLSLNEETQRIEPHRINGLLDMGIKSVYRLTTAGGRSIETTANHPYLTKNGWVKVNGLKTGDEIAVPELRSFVKDEDSEINCQKQTSNNKEDNIIHKDLPLTYDYPDKNNQCQYSGKDIKAQKVHGFFGSILDSLTAILRNNTVMAMPIENVSQGIFPAASGTNTPITNEANINFAPSRKKSDTTSNLSLDNIQHNATIQRVFVKDNICIEVKSKDILWDRIVSIEYIGYEHVYDIEVEGTHNFIGNGIFAHNTYVNKGEGNISCGTICESGHEGSYDALDEQLKRQFGKLREILGITEERNLTEPEADRALMVYAKRHGIDITYEQLQEFRSQIKEAEEGVRSIEIFFAIPETGTELFWAGDDYAGGHFNRKGTRIHISLPVIQKRGIEAGVAIANHELAHIQDKVHQEDFGLQIVKGIANVDKWVVLLDSLKWKLKAFRRYAAPVIGEGWINLADLLKRLDLVEVFRERYNKVYKEKFGFVKKIADYFGISDTALRQLKTALGITDPELDIDITEGSLLPVIEMGKEDVLRRLRAMRWNFKKLRKRLNLSSNLGIYELIIGLGIKEEFEKKFRQIYRARLGWYRLIAGYFDVHEKILKGIIRRLGIDVSDIEPFTRGSILRVHKLDKQDILTMLDRCGWKLLSFRKKLAKKNIIPVSTAFSDMIIGLDVKAEFLARFDEAYRNNQGNFGKTARGFGLWDADMRDLLKALGRVGFEKGGFVRFEEGQLLKIAEMTLEQLMGLFREKRWRLDELMKHFRNMGWLKKKISYIDFIKGLGIVRQFSEELLKISWANSGKWGLISDHFGVDGITLSSIVAKLGIKIEVRDEYPILERGTRLRDPSGNIYELLGPRYKGKDEVLLSPETILVLRKVDNRTIIVRISAKEAFTTGWDLLVDAGGTAIIPYFQKKFGRFGETKLYKLLVGPIVEEIIFRGIPLVIGAFAFTISPILGKVLLAVWSLVLYKWFVNLHEEGKRTPAKAAGLFGVLFIALPFFFTQLPWWIIFGAIIFHSSVNIFQTVQGKGYTLAVIKRKQIDSGGIKWEEESSENRLEILGENEGVVTRVYKAGYKGEVYWAKFADDEEGEERLVIPQAEIIKYLNRLNIPGVCTAEHFLELKDGRKAILFKKFPHGELLEKRKAKLSEEEKIDIMLKILYVVRDLHRAGVRHWDIKLENIWLTDEGEVILFDFDFAFRTDRKEEFRTRGLQATMSPSYASEKRASWQKGNYPKNENEFPHTPEELYSLGMVLLNLIADSEVPVIAEEETPYRYANKQLDRLQEKQEVPSGLRRILNRALFWGSCSYQDISEFIKDFRMFQYRYKAEQLWFPGIEEKRRLANEIRGLGIKITGWKRAPVEYLEDILAILKNLREEDRKHVSTIQLVPWYRSLYFWLGSLDLAKGVVTIPIRSVFRWLLVRRLGHLIMQKNQAVSDRIAGYSWSERWFIDYKKPWLLLGFYSLLGRSEDAAEGFTTSILSPGLKDTRFGEKYSLLTRNLPQVELGEDGRRFSKKSFLFFSLFIHLMVFTGLGAPKFFLVLMALFGYITLIILLNEPVFLYIFSDYGKWIDRVANRLSETARRAFRFGTYIISRTLYELPKLLIVTILILTISFPARIMDTLLGDEKAIGEPAEELTIELTDLPGKPILPGEEEKIGKVDSTQEPQLQGDEATEGATKELLGSTPGNVQKGGRIMRWRGDYWYHGDGGILLHKYDVIADNIRFNLSGYHSVSSIILLRNWRYPLNIEPFKELIIHIKDIEAGKVGIQIHGPGSTIDDETVLDFGISGGPQDIHIPTSIIKSRKIDGITFDLYPTGDRYYEKQPFHRPLNIESIEVVPKEKTPAKKVPGGRWPWLRDVLTRYGLPSWLQVPIEQAFIGLGYVLYYSGFHILSVFIIPIFIGLHYVWKKGRVPSIRDILLVSLINLIGFILATPILAPIMFILSSIAHYLYNTLVAVYRLPQEAIAVFKEEGEYSTLSEQTIKDLLIFEPRIGLFDFVNETITTRGEDRLRWLLTHPFLDGKEILARQEIVCHLMNNPSVLMQIREILAIFSQRQDINGTVIMLRKCIESLPRDNIYSQYFRTVIQKFMQRPWDTTILCKVLGLIGELDAFSSLAQSGLRYASSEKGHITMPRIVEQAEPLFQIKQGIILGNFWQKRVPNDIELSSEKSFALITGPNSSGKTMLLRTMGISAILAQIGSSVPAEDMAITPMRIHSLISISDDPQTGRSYTEVEVDELSGILDSTAKGSKQIYLIDEMLRGMYRNARDTIEPDVVKLLANSGALTVLTTHNSSLTELAEEGKNIANYHFTDGNRYRLMHGKATTNNALRIMEEMGWRDVDLPRPKYPDRYVEPQVVSVENENIKGERIHVFNREAITTWKRLTELLINRLDRLKAKIEKKRGFYSRDTASFILFIVIYGGLRGYIEGTREEMKKGMPMFTTGSIITAILLIIIPLLYGIYIYAYEKPVFLVRRRGILNKILAKKEDEYTKSQIQQALESYLEKTGVRPDDVNPWGGRHRDTYPIEETTAQALKLIDGEKNLLSTVDHTRTIWGRHRLKWLLTNPYKDTERIRNRQKIVRTLSEKRETRKELTRYLEEMRDSWQRNVISQKPPRFNNTFKIALFLGLIISGIAYTQAMWGYSFIGFSIAIIAFFNWLFFKLHSKEVKVLAYVNDVIRTANRIKEVLETSGIDNNPEIEKLLKDLDTVNGVLEELKTSKGFLSGLKTIFTMDETRHERIRSMFFKKDAQGYDYAWVDVLSVIGELDAYVSLAELPERFPNWKTMPEIAEPDRGVPVLDIEEGYSPIISPEISQPNSILLNGDNRVLVIGGAHGAGKSTFLRTINQLEVLGSIGSYVPARHMKFTPVQILASMNVQDAPGEGLSYFGKVGRFLNSLYWGQRPSIFDETAPLHIVSFDEFLEGTNTPEARIIAEAVIKWLSEHNIPAVIVSQDTEVLKIVNSKRIPKVNIAHPKKVVVSGKRFAYIIVPGLPDEIAICRELLKRPLNRHLRKAIFKVMQGKAELEDIPDAGGIEVDSNRMVETSV